MNKDVIYIDIDDDVTAIIGKIKKSKEKIVAIVPPKRAGALQSAVNLRLLDRMAKTSKKQLVLITNNAALIALSASAKIPVAKNLQSKPEIAEIAAIAVDEGDDIIDGADLPVGDHAASVEGAENDTDTVSRSDVIDSLDIDGEVTPADEPRAAVAKSAKPGATKSKVVIPNFDRFRKRLFLGIGGGVLLAALIVWMFAFAPSAVVTITAKASPAPVSASVKLGDTAATDFKTGVISSLRQQEKKDESVEFDATGQKDLGTQATGIVRFSTNQISALGTTIAAGTKLTSASGAVFATNNAVTITIDNYTGVNVDITAVANGISSNGATGSVSGAPSGISAALTAATAGGTSRIVKSVSADDIERAKGVLIGASTDEQKAALVKKFADGETVIESSFSIERADGTSVPAVDAEAPASGKAKLTIPTTYTLYAVPKTALESFLDAALNAQIKDSSTQKVYATGADSATISNFKKDGDTLSVSIAATGQIGPKIDEVAVKEQVKGKIYGDVQKSLEAIDGVQEVDVSFSFFWVTRVPNDTSKIRVEFKLQNEE